MNAAAWNIFTFFSNFDCTVLYVYWWCSEAHALYRPSRWHQSIYLLFFLTGRNPLRTVWGNLTSRWPSIISRAILWLQIWSRQQNSPPTSTRCDSWVSSSAIVLLSQCNYSRPARFSIEVWQKAWRNVVYHCFTFSPSIRVIFWHVGLKS